MSALGWAILKEAEAAEEPEAFRWAGFYRCQAKTERNAAFPIHVLMRDGEWRDTHRRNRGLGVCLIGRPMTDDELAGERHRLVAHRYTGLLPLLQDELDRGGLPWIGSLLTVFGDVHDFEAARLFVRDQHAKAR